MFLKMTNSNWNFLIFELFLIYSQTFLNESTITKNQLAYTPLCNKSVRTGLYNFRTLISVHVRLLWRTEYLDFILLPRKITYIWIFAPKTRHVLIRFAHMKKPCTLLHCIYKMFLWLEFWGPNVDVCWYLIQDFLFKRYVHWSIWKHFDTSCY